MSLALSFSSYTNNIISAKDHASVQINIAEVGAQIPATAGLSRWNLFFGLSFVPFRLTRTPAERLERTRHSPCVVLCEEWYVRAVMVVSWSLCWRSSTCEYWPVLFQLFVKCLWGKFLLASDSLTALPPWPVLVPLLQGEGDDAMNRLCMDSKLAAG